MIYGVKMPKISCALESDIKLRPDVFEVCHYSHQEAIL
jgi:hypothetical protein